MLSSWAPRGARRSRRTRLLTSKWLKSRSTYGPDGYKAAQCNGSRPGYRSKPAVPAGFILSRCSPDHAAACNSSVVSRSFSVRECFPEIAIDAHFGRRVDWSPSPSPGCGYVPRSRRRTFSNLSMSRKLNIAIVGLGFRIRVHPHLPAASACPHVCRLPTLEGEAGPDRQGVRREKRYTAFEDLIRDLAVDAVHINSPIHHIAS